MKLKVGDEGQRYEIRFISNDGEEHIAGWTNDPSGGALAKSIEAHPILHSPRIIDREADKEI